MRHVLRGNQATTFIVSIETRQFQTQYGGLKFIQATVYTFIKVDILCRRAIIGDRTNHRSKRLIIGSHCTTISQCTQVLCRIETESGCISKATGTFPVINGTMSLCRILHNFEIMTSCYIFNRLHISTSSV